MQEEHLAGLCLALCLNRHLGHMKTSRGHERKHSARVERSTPDCAGAKALQDLSEMILKVGLLAVEPRDETVMFAGYVLRRLAQSFQDWQAGTVYARILPRCAVQMGTAPGMKLVGPRPRLCLGISDQRVCLAPCGPKRQGLACQDAHPHTRREGLR